MSITSLTNDINGKFRTSNGSISEYLDIWLLGSILYEARKFQAFLFSLKESGSALTYFVDNGKKALPYPSMANIQDELLISALKCMLHKDPHRRSPASSLLFHPYFSKAFLVYSGAPYRDLFDVYKAVADLKCALFLLQLTFTSRLPTKQQNNNADSSSCLCVVR